MRMHHKKRFLKRWNWQKSVQILNKCSWAIRPNFQVMQVVYRGDKNNALL
uniref:Lactococcus lactus ATP-binding protein (lceA), export/processing protein (lcmA), lactococcin A bacteriocin (lcnA), and lactococcin A immunity (lciA, and lciA2) genes n=1 Tax=Lactococcus lactis TaxID=1358 RepID=Q48657_9LACT|nr:ORF2 [Lactococcus lactis]